MPDGGQRPPPTLITSLAPLNRLAPLLPLLHTLVEERAGERRFNEHDCVVLTADLPGEKLQRSDVGTVVHIHKGGVAYEVEFTTLDGRTLTVATVESKKLRPVSRRDVAHVRELQAGREDRFYGGSMSH
jgi:hypothetical protein